MLDVYLVLTVVLAGASIFAFIFALVDWAAARNRYGRSEDEIKKEARVVLASVGSILLAPLWPLTLPLLFLYVLICVLKDAR